MGKVIWKPGTMIYPVPAVMVSCGNENDGYNIVTVAWTGTLCTDPAMCYISLRPSRFSYDIIKKNGEYVINLTTSDLAGATDWCGVRSGRDFRKFEETGLTPGKASIVSAPIIMEAPLSIECRVREIKELGTHHMFISEVVAIDADDRFIDPRTGVFRLDKASPLSYSHGKYYELGSFIGKFGFSVKGTGKPKGRRKKSSGTDK